MSSNDIRFYYFNARWYDPQLGRFITEDPIKDGLNWYAYVNNNPLNRIDPTGLREILDTDRHGQNIYTQEQKIDDLRGRVNDLDKEIEKAPSPGALSNVYSKQLDLMGEHNQLIEYTSESFYPGSVETSGFAVNQGAVPYANDKYPSFRLWDVDAHGGIDRAYSNYNPDTDGVIKGTTGGLYLTPQYAEKGKVSYGIIGLDRTLDISHVDDSEVSRTAGILRSIIRPGGNIVDYPTQKNGISSGIHVHIVEKQNGMRANPDTHQVSSSAFRYRLLNELSQAGRGAAPGGTHEWTPWYNQR